MSLWDKAEPVRDVDLPHTLVLERHDGTYDENEQPIKTTVSISCRKEGRMNRVIDFKGREVMSEAFIMTTETITPEDTVTINSVVYPVLRIDEISELDGTFSHNEIYVGRSSGS